MLGLVLLSLVGCGDDAIPLDGSADAADAADAGDAGLPTGPVVSTYEGDHPPRDGFCAAGEDAQPLDELPVTLRVDTRRSRTDHARPSTACAVSSGTPVPDLVFSYTPRVAGVFTMRADLAGTDPWIDTVLYARSACAGTPAPGAELGCNDDAAVASGHSRLSVDVLADAPIFAVVDGLDETDVGEVEVTFDFVPRPVPSGPGGDSCVAATELRFSGDGDTLLAVAEGDTTDASNDGGCAGVPSTNSLPDRFYAFTLPDPRDVLVRVTPDPDYDTAFYVQRDCDDPETLACHDTGPPGFSEALDLEALPAGRYVVGVDAFEHPEAPDWERGPYRLEVIATAP